MTEITALRAKVKRLNTRVADLEDEKGVWESGLLPREETIRLAGYAEGFALAHEPARCGHARANYKDPEYGTEQYPTKTQCEACAIEGRAEAAEAERDEVSAQLAACQEIAADWHPASLDASVKDHAVTALARIKGIPAARARSMLADVARFQWLLDGNGYFMEESGLCGHAPCDDEEKDDARGDIDAAMKAEADREGERKNVDS